MEKKGIKFEVMPKLRNLRRGLPRDPNEWIYKARNLRIRIEFLIHLGTEGYLPYKTELKELRNALAELTDGIERWQAIHERM